MLKTLGYLFAWLWAFFFLLATLLFFAQRIRARAVAAQTGDAAEEEAEKWRRAFEGTEYEWEPNKRSDKTA